MSKFYLSKIMLFCFFIQLLIFNVSYSDNVADNKKNILIINSYNENFSWTKEIMNGISSVINKRDAMNNVYIDYMDFKTVRDEKYIESFYNLQKNKYKDIKIDIIICSDNGALDYLLKYRDILFSKVPVVFCGINTPYSPLANKENLYTGITENISVTEMFDQIIKFHPYIRTLDVFVGSTSTGTATKQDIQNSYNNTKPSFDINFYTDLKADDIKKVMSASDNNTVALFAADPVRNYLNNPKYLSDINDSFFKNSKVPIYSFWGSELNYGIVGGELIYGFSQGQSAAEIALGILEGEALQDAKSLAINSNKYIFDYNRIKQFKIPLEKLPENSIIINKPFSFYETYKTIVIVITVIILLLLTIIFMLWIFFKQKSEDEKKINASYEKLSAVYDQLAITDEELRAQFDELERTEELLRINEERFRLAVDGSNDAIFEWDISEDKLFISDAWTEITGYSVGEERESLKSHCDKVIYNDDYVLLADNFKKYLNNCEDFFKSEIRVNTSTGMTKWILIRGKGLKDQWGEIVKMSGSMTDISERKEYQEKIEKMAYYDFLTGFPNKRLFIEKTMKIIKDKHPFAMLFLDLDEFKKINDTLGHQYGDELIIIIGDKLKTLLSKENLISRFGGDEYLILLPQMESRTETEKTAIKIMNIFKEPFMVNNTLNYITASMGIGLYPDDGDSIDMLLKNVDTAMYKAKEKGKDQYCFFDKIMSDKVLKDANIEKELRNAIKNNELLIYYQPQIDITDGSIVGMEALIRWESKELGFVLPNDFIPIAEKNGMIIPIGIWIFENVCNQIKIWKEKNYKFQAIAINVSPIQLKQQGFIDRFSEIIRALDFPSEYIELEITESVLIDNPDENIKKLKEVKDLGVKIALDDFGTGFSSLNYLRILPIDKVKIDKSFIDEICLKSKQSLITNEIISLCHKLSYDVVAEGVENYEQVVDLIQMKCDYAQGYYYSKPISSESMEKILKNGTISLLMQN